MRNKNKPITTFLVLFPSFCFTPDFLYLLPPRWHQGDGNGAGWWSLHHTLPLPLLSHHALTLLHLGAHPMRDKLHQGESFSCASVLHGLLQRGSFPLGTNCCILIKPKPPACNISSFCGVYLKAHPKDIQGINHSFVRCLLLGSRSSKCSQL